MVDNLNSLSSLWPLSVSSQLLDFPKRHLHRRASFLAIFFLIIIIINIITTTINNNITSL